MRRSKRGVLYTLVLVTLALRFSTGCPEPPPPTNTYPIVLAHGLLGDETYELGGYEILDYWFGIVSAMEDEGAQVFVTTVSPINSSYVRGAQLQAQVENIIAVTGAPKVHIIGHSQGGLDARYVAGMRPDLVRSVTTVATPNSGVGLGDFFDENITEQGTILGGLLNLFGPLLEDFARLITGSDDPLDWKAGFEFLGDVETFNVDFPNGLPTTPCTDGPGWNNGIRYFSWTGDIVAPLGVRIITNVLDPTDVLFNTASLFYGLLEDSDGLVPVCSSRFGETIGTYTMNHLDEVNQIVGLVSILETNPKTLFRNHVGRLYGLQP